MREVECGIIGAAQALALAGWASALEAHWTSIGWRPEPMRLRLGYDAWASRVAYFARRGTWAARITAAVSIGRRKTTAFVTIDDRCGLREVELDVYPPSPGGEELRRRRVGADGEQHITLGVLSRHLGISPATLSGLETGSRTLADAAEWDALFQEVADVRSRLP